MQETRVQSLGRADPLEKEMATIPVFLSGKSHGQRSLAGDLKESDAAEHVLATSHSLITEVTFITVTLIPRDCVYVGHGIFRTLPTPCTNCAN